MLVVYKKRRMINKVQNRVVSSKSFIKKIWQRKNVGNVKCIIGLWEDRTLNVGF